MSDPINALYNQLEDANQRCEDLATDVRDLTTRLDTIIGRLKNVYRDGTETDVLEEVFNIIGDYHCSP